MTSGSTREFMALVRDRPTLRAPAHPTDQAHIETLFGHIKTEYPHLEQIDDPAVLRAELERARTHYNTVHRHEGIGYVTPTTSTRDAAPRSAKPDATAWNAHASSASATIASTTRRSPKMRTNHPGDLCHKVRHTSYAADIGDGRKAGSGFGH